VQSPLTFAYVQRDSRFGSIDIIDIGNLAAGWRQLFFAAPAALDFDHDGDLDLIVGISSGNLRTFAMSGCTREEPGCSMGGTCSISGRCDCLAGFGGARCETCAEGYFTARASSPHVCVACPGANESRVCSHRGVCDDDRSAKAGSESATLAMLALGTGTCACRGGAFSGASCNIGTCPPGTTEVGSADGRPNVCSNCSAGYFSDPASGQTTCTVCPTGRAAAEGKGEGACPICAAGRFAARGSAACGTCPGGTYSWEEQGTCARCQPGRYAPQGAPNCSSCPSGSVPNANQDACVVCAEGHVAKNESASCTPCQSAAAPTNDRSTCMPCLSGNVFLLSFSEMGACRDAVDYALIACMFLMGILNFAGAYILAAHVRHRVRIDDLTSSGDRIVITASKPHGMRHWSRMRTKVRLAATGHPAADAQQVFCVHVLDDRRLELQSLAGAPICDSWESSMGSFTLCFPYDFVNTGTVAPTVVLGPLLILPVWLLLGLPVVEGFFASRSMPQQSLAVAVSAMVGGVGAGVVVAIVVRCLRAHSMGQLEKRLQQFRKRALQRNPSPKACARGPLRAVLVSHLSELLEFFDDFIRQRNAYYLNGNIIKPWTRPYKLSYAELIGPARVQFFVSHFWGTCFRHFVETVRKHAEGTGIQEWRSLSYWICFLSNNQWNVAAEVGEGKWEESSFYLALRSGFCRATCMVLDDKALPLTRSWCLFEVLQTFVLLHSDCAGDFEGLVFCTKEGALGMARDGCADVSVAVAKRLSCLSVADARASEPRDEEMIKRLVQEEGGMEQMNGFIRGNMCDTLAKEKAQFNCEIDKVVEELHVANPDREGGGKPTGGRHGAPRPSLWKAARGAPAAKAGRAVDGRPGDSEPGLADHGEVGEELSLDHRTVVL